MYAGTLRQDKPPCDASASVTTGLKCAPEMGPKVGNQRDERSARRDCVRKERDGDIAARQTLPHDA
jgi:hypothetical protein